MKKAITVCVLLLSLAALGVTQERATPVDSARGGQESDGRKGLPEIKEAKKAAERNPNSTEILLRLVRLYGESVEDQQKQVRMKEVRELLQGWAARHPESSALQLALADTYSAGSECEQHLLKAVKLNPKLTEAYDRLISLAELSAQDAKAAEYAKRAYESDPTDARLRKYAMRLAESDPAAHRKLLEGVIVKRPDTPMSAWAALSLALKEDPQKRMRALADVMAKYPPERFPEMSAAKSQLILHAALTDPGKALAMAQNALQLAQAAAQASEQTKVSWLDSPAAHASSMKELVTYLDNIVKARTLLDNNKAAEALVLLDQACPPHHAGNAIFLLKAEAAYRDGNTQKAYDDLAALVADRADPQLNSELQKYAARLGKTPQQVEAELWQLRDRRSKPFKDFELTTYDGKKVKLSDYRGKVVLLTFWFPH